MKKSKSNRIFPKDLAPIGYCCSGARGVFEAYGLSWADFLKYGADCDALLALDDPVVTAVVVKFKQGKE